MNYVRLSEGHRCESGYFFSFWAEKLALRALVLVVVHRLAYNGDVAATGRGPEGCVENGPAAALPVGFLSFTDLTFPATASRPVSCMNCSSAGNPSGCAYTSFECGLD
jgi:hypothetical protein